MMDNQKCDIYIHIRTWVCAIHDFLRTCFVGEISCKPWDRMGYRVDKSTAATKNLGHVGLKHYSRWTFYTQFTSVFFFSGYSSNSNVVDPDLQRQPLSLRFSQICIPRLILEGTIMVVSFFFVFLSTVPVIAQMGLALS